MQQTSSYTIETFASSVSREIQRLEGQLDLFWEKELAHYRRCGLADGQRVLDCGSGPGHLVYRLTEALPNSAVSGLEIDPVMVQAARQMLENAGADSGAITQGSVLATGLEDEQFDFIICRLVLEHLPDPVAAVREVVRILKPEGVAVFVDNDFAFHPRTRPNIPELEDLYRAYCACRTDEGGNPFIGRELPQVLQDGGLGRIDLTLIAAHSLVNGDDAFLKSEGAGISSQLIRDGYLDKGIFDALVAKWRAMLAEEKHSIFRQLFYCSGTKTPRKLSAGRNKIAVVSSKAADTAPGPIPRTAKTKAPAIKKPAAIAAYLHDLMVPMLSLRDAFLPPDEPLDELGIDSLAAATIQAHLAEDFDVDVSIADFFNGQTLEGLSTMVAHALEQKPIDGSASSGKERPASEKATPNDWEEGEL